MSNVKFGLVVVAFIGLIVWMSAFIVHERELAIKFKLGEIVTTIDGAPFSEVSRHRCRSDSGRTATLPVGSRPAPISITGRSLDGRDSSSRTRCCTSLSRQVFNGGIG